MMPCLVRMHTVVAEQLSKIPAGKEAGSYVNEPDTFCRGNPVQLQVVHLVPVPYRIHSTAEPPQDIVPLLSAETRADIRVELYGVNGRKRKHDRNAAQFPYLYNQALIRLAELPALFTFAACLVILKK